MAFTIPTIFSAIDKVTAPVEKMAKSLGLFGQEADTAMARVDRRFSKLSDGATAFAKKSFLVGAAIVAPLALAANEAIKFEDKMADVAKTTGLSGDGLKKYGDELLTMSGSTRTSIDDLIKISEIGGQLGVLPKDLLGFTDAMDKFNVALGSDFSGGVEEAATQVGKIKSLFAETKGLNIADAITKTGSAINGLGSVGAGTSANITDFTLRMGQLPGALRPTLQDTLALGTYLEEAGLKSEVASGGLTKFLLVAGENIGKFANQMRLTTDKAKELLATKPTEFIKTFATSLNGLKPDQLAQLLGKLGIGTQETIKVLGALGSNIGRVGELQNISSDLFEKGTGLLDEYAKKNGTTAAELDKMKNNLQVIGILLGNELLPLISKALKYILPFIKGVISWVKENKALAGTLVTIVALIGGFVLAVSAISGIVAIAAEAVLAWSAITKAYIAVQWALNAAITANPIGLVIVAIAALIALVAIIIVKYDEWGAALNAVLAIFLPGLALIIGLVMTFIRNWDRITEAFKSKGIVAGIMAIGTTLLDVVLMPLQQILEIISKVTGFDWASDAAKGVEQFRRDLGVTMEGDTKQAINPEAERQKNYVELIDKKQQNIAMTINDKTGRATMESDNNIFMPKLTSTQ
jgi:TP901 family phage tail tape measure protein